MTTTDQTPDTDAIDVEQKLRAMREAPFTTCPSCGVAVEPKKLRKHRMGLECQARAAAKKLRAGGLTIYNSRFLIRIVQRAGLTLEAHATDFHKGRKHSTAKILRELWGPAWVHNLIGERFWEMQGDLDEQEAVEIYGAAFEAAEKDPEIKEAMFATKRLHGTPALVNLIIDRKVKAAKARKQCEALLTQAAALELRANELDPPREDGAVTPWQQVLVPKELASPLESSS